VQQTALRFGVGLGLGGLIPIDTTLVSEFMPAARRGRMVALWAVSFPIGGLAAAWLVTRTLPTLGWRGVFLLGVAPALLILPIRRFVPESPRFLITKGRFGEAERSVRWIADGTPLPALDRQVPEPPESPVSARVRDLLRPPQLRSTAVAMTMTFLWSFGFFGTVLWLPTLLVLAKFPLTQVLWYTIGFQLSAIAGRLAALVVVDRLGRKPVIVTAGVAAAALALVFGLSGSLHWLVVVGFLLSFCQDGGMSGVVPYTPELYATPLRATGVGWTIGAGRVAGLLAPLLVGTLASGGATYAIFAVFSACYAGSAIVVAALGTETNGTAFRHRAPHTP
jgi:putative MFS transporter